MTPSAGPATVFIADDDDNTRSAIEKAVRSVGLRTQAFSSAAELASHVSLDQPGCIILDLHVGGTTAAGAQHMLKERGCRLPVIVVTGPYDVSTAVDAMRAGALDVLPRPFNDQALIDDVHRAIVHDRLQRQMANDVRKLQQRYVQLTRREREVMALVIAGLPNKQAGAALGITERTVKAHRAQVLQKMMAASIVDLIRMGQELSSSAPAPPVDDRPVRLRP